MIKIVNIGISELSQLIRQAVQSEIIQILGIPNNEEPILISRKEACSILGVSIPTIESHSQGLYSGELWYCTATNAHTLNTGDIIHNSWALHSYTNLFVDGVGTLPSEMQNEMILSNVTNSSADLMGMTVKITHGPGGADIADFWYPVAPGETAKFAYTLHIETDFAGVEEPEIDTEFQLSCYPNPTTGNFTVAFNLMEDAVVTVEISDINGRLVKSVQQQQYTAGQQTVNFDVSTMAKGIYVLKVSVNDESYYEKFVKE